MGKSAIQRGTEAANQLVAKGMTTLGINDGIRKAADLLQNISFHI